MRSFLNKPLIVAVVNTSFDKTSVYSQQSLETAGGPLLPAMDSLFLCHYLFNISCQCSSDSVFIIIFVFISGGIYRQLCLCVCVWVICPWSEFHMQMIHFPAIWFPWNFGSGMIHMEFLLWFQRIRNDCFTCFPWNRCWTVSRSCHGASAHQRTGHGKFQDVARWAAGQTGKPWWDEATENGGMNDGWWCSWWSLSNISNNAI